MRQWMFSVCFIVPLAFQHPLHVPAKADTPPPGWKLSFRERVQGKDNVVFISPDGAKFRWYINGKLNNKGEIGWK